MINLIVFYIYQTPKDIISISPPLNKDNSKLLVDIYLKEKFKNDFNNLLYDKNYINTLYYKNIFKSLYDSYFNLISYINCFCPLSSNTYTNIEKNYLNLDESSKSPTFFKILNSSINKLQYNNKINLIRDICIEAITLFFSYSITNDLIVDEYYEIFFENNPENKFYQFFFRLDIASFKVRIYDKSNSILYLSNP